MIDLYEEFFKAIDYEHPELIKGLPQPLRKDIETLEKNINKLLRKRRKNRRQLSNKLQ